MLDLKWRVVPHGGEWSIVDEHDTTVADSIPHGEVADAIANAHNLELLWSNDDWGL